MKHGGLFEDALKQMYASRRRRIRNVRIIQGLMWLTVGVAAWFALR